MSKTNILLSSTAASKGWEEASHGILALYFVFLSKLIQLQNVFFMNKQYIQTKGNIMHHGLPEFNLNSLEVF